MGLLQSYGRYRSGDGQARLTLLDLQLPAFARPCQAFAASTTPTSRANACCCASTLQRADAGRKVADATRIEEIAPTIEELADKGGKVILLAFRPAEGSRSEIFAAPGGARNRKDHRAVRSPSPRIASARKAVGRGRRDERTATFSVWKIPASIPAKRRTTRTSPKNWRRSATCSSTTPFSAAHRAARRQHRDRDGVEAAGPSRAAP